MIVRNSLLVLAAVVAVSEAGNVQRIRNRNVIKVEGSTHNSKSHSLMQENKKVENDLASLFKETGRGLQDMSMSMGGGGGGMSMSMDMDMSPARSKPTFDEPVTAIIPPQQVADEESDGDAPTLVADEPIDAVTDGATGATGDDSSSGSSTTTTTDSTSDNSDSSRSPGEEAIVESTGADSAAATFTNVGVAATAVALVYSLLA